MEKDVDSAFDSVFDKLKEIESKLDKVLNMSENPSPVPKAYDFTGFTPNLMKFEELEANGVKPGDIIVEGKYLSEWYVYDYYLLRKDDFGKRFNTALCCTYDPRMGMHLYRIGFSWCDSTDHFRFRKCTDYEKQEFINACVARLSEKIEPNDIWGVPEYAQILAAMIKYDLIDDDYANKLSRIFYTKNGKSLLREAKIYL